MALHNVEGLNSIDNVVQRLGAGTIGGEHIVPGSLGGKGAISTIDNTNPNVVYGYYGTGTASFTRQTGAPFSSGGTVVWTESPNAAIQLKFVGTSVGIIAPTNPTGDDSAEVYIDGELAYGRVPIYSSQGFPGGSSSLSEPSVPVGGTTVNVTDDSNFAASGYLIIDDEIIEYSSVSSGVFTISERGALGTQEVDHYYDATVYQWSNILSFYNTSGWATKELIFYNPFLSNGPHTITMVCSGGGGDMFLDSFVVGSLLGAKNINTQTGTAAVTVTTSANGHVDIGALTSVNTDVQIIGVVGYEQTIPSTGTDTANTMAKLGVRYDVVATGGSQAWQPIFYLHNGPAVTAVTVRITFTYLGESI